MTEGQRAPISIRCHTRNVVAVGITATPPSGEVELLSI